MGSHHTVLSPRKSSQVLAYEDESEGNRFLGGSSLLNNSVSAFATKDCSSMMKYRDSGSK
jgi:hypothetical protein